MEEIEIPSLSTLIGHGYLQHSGAGKRVSCILLSLFSDTKWCREVKDSVAFAFSASVKRIVGGEIKLGAAHKDYLNSNHEEKKGDSAQSKVGSEELSDLKE